LIYSPEAETDLIESWVYLAENGDAEISDRVLSSIWSVCAMLLKNPEIGRSREEYSAGLRSIVHERFVIFYRLRQSQLEIVRILHSAPGHRPDFGRLTVFPKILTEVHTVDHLDPTHRAFEGIEGSVGRLSAALTGRARR